MGAWIEIIIVISKFVILAFVAPFMGAWIEIVIFVSSRIFTLASHPSWVRGLKYALPLVTKNISFPVAPFMGAWIEIMK